MKEIRKKNRNKSDNSTHENAKQCVKFLLSILLIQNENKNYVKAIM